MISTGISDRLLGPSAPVELGGLVVLEGSSRLPGFAQMRNTYGDHDVDNTHVSGSGHISNDSVELLGYVSRARRTRRLAGDDEIEETHTIHSHHSLMLWCSRCL